MAKVMNTGSSLATAAAAAAEATGKGLRRLSTGSLRSEPSVADQSTETHACLPSSMQSQPPSIATRLQGAMIRRVNVTSSGRVAISTEEAQFTFQDVFLAGGAASNVSRRLSIAVGDSPQLEVSYFPDPLYVMNAADADPAASIGVKQQGQASNNGGLLGYWKDHATWFAWDPNVTAVRDRGRRFRDTWLASGGPQAHAFVCVAANTLRLYEQPSLEAPVLESEGIEPGECIVVNEEATVDQGGARFVEVAGRGWATERFEDTVLLARLRDVDVQQRFFRVVASSCVHARRAPSFDDEARTNWVLSPQEMLPVSMTCSVHGSTFVQLADGRGWLFIRQPSSKTEVGTMHRVEDVNQPLVIQACDGQLQGRRGSEFICPRPTSEVVEIGAWSYVVGDQPVLVFCKEQCGNVLKPGTVLMVDKRALATCPGEDPRSSGDAQPLKQNARWWLRLIGQGAWVPLLGPEGTVLLHELEEQVGSHSRSSQRQSIMWTPSTEPWMTGVA